LTPTAEPEGTATTAPESVLIEVGHRLPNGQIVQHDALSSVQFGISLFGGDVMMREVHYYPWAAMPEQFQPRWVTPE
jgi:hypothetical protein